MPPRVPIPRGFFAFSFALLFVGRADAQLAAKSPFMTAPAAGSAAPTAASTLEYRGMMETAEGRKARVIDPTRHNLGGWLRVDERDPSLDFVVKQIDVEGDTVTVDYQGRTVKLAQHVAKVVSAGVAQMPPSGAPNPASNMPAAITQSVVVNPTPADEQRRLEAVASEVARRRQLREQASQPGAPAAAPAVQPQAQPQLAPPNAGSQNGGQRGAQRPRGNQP